MYIEFLPGGFGAEKGVVLAMVCFPCLYPDIVAKGAPSKYPALLWAAFLMFARFFARCILLLYFFTLFLTLVTRAEEASGKLLCCVPQLLPSGTA